MTIDLNLWERLSPSWACLSWACRRVEGQPRFQFLNSYHSICLRTEVTKSQNPSTKLGPRPEGGDSEGEITNKSQIPILNDQNRFGILVIVICLIFVICNLDFPSLHHSITPSLQYSTTPLLQTECPNFTSVPYFYFKLINSIVGNTGQLVDVFCWQRI